MIALRARNIIDLCALRPLRQRDHAIGIPCLTLRIQPRIKPPASRTTMKKITMLTSKRMLMTTSQNPMKLTINNRPTARATRKSRNWGSNEPISTAPSTARISDPSKRIALTAERSRRMSSQIQLRAIMSRIWMTSSNTYVGFIAKTLIEMRFSLYAPLLARPLLDPRIY